jgi:mannose-6-phosphate isomerase-like protein (cupin superfamily)
MNPYLSRYLRRRPPEFPTREHCFVRELVNHPSVPAASVAECRVEPGVVTELHRLSVAEWYLVRQGAGLMEVAGDAPFEVGPGDVVAVPAGASQRIRNNGSDDLVFDCLCVPRFTPDCYEALESRNGGPAGVA